MGNTQRFRKILCDKNLHLCDKNLHLYRILKLFTINIIHRYLSKIEKGLGPGLKANSLDWVVYVIGLHHATTENKYKVTLASSGFYLLLPLFR